MLFFYNTYTSYRNTGKNEIDKNRVNYNERQK